MIQTESRNYKIYNFILRNYYWLQFSPTIVTDLKEVDPIPKYIQREVRKQKNTGIGTKSQQDLKLQQE